MTRRADAGQRGRGFIFAANAGLVVAGMLALIAIFYGGAALNIEAPARHLAEAFEDGTLSHDVARQLEAVPGFVVMESDYEGACSSYGHMLSPSDALFGLGMRPVGPIYGCEALDVTVHQELGQNFSPYYRYWQGAAAFNRIGLSLVSVFWWQVALTGALVALVLALIWRLWPYSRTLSAGTAVALLLMSDFPWQGMAPLHGTSSIMGLIFAHLALSAFARGWMARWGIAVLAGASYAMVAHTLIPMAFAILLAIVAMTPLLKHPSRLTNRSLAVGFGVGLLWSVGYVLGTASRALWVATLGPGPQQVLDEWLGTGGGFLIHSWIDPFSQTLGNLIKTWFAVGFMQIGLILFAVALGWSLAKGGAQGFRFRATWVALSPALLGAGWLIVWANHTNHTYVHALFSLIAMNALFASEVGRVIAARHVRERTLG